MRRAELLLVSSLVAAASVSFADDASAGPEDLAVAEKLFEEGQREMAAGNLAKACPHLAESRRLDPQIGVTLYLADCLQRTGKIATAWGLFRDAAQAAVAVQDNRAAIAKKRADALEPRLANVTISVDRPADIAGLELTQDDAPVPRARWNLPVPIDPGEHVVSAHASGHRIFRRTFSIERDGQVLTIDVPRLETEAPTPIPASRAAAPADRADRAPAKRSSPMRAAAYALFGGAALSLGVGTFFGVRALGNANDVKGLCPAYPACTSATAGQATALNDDAHTNATVSTIGFAVSGAVLALAVVLLLRE